MRVPLNWLKDFVEITLPIEELARRLTMAGIEVAAIERIGLPAPARDEAPSPRHTWRVEEGGKRSPLAWDRDKIFVGEIVEIKPHPHADRLVLGVVDYGAEEYETVVTGAPNLFPYLGVKRPGLKVSFALEGARLYDGHAEGWKVMVLKRAKIRGVPSRAMVCSEKELGLSEDHEGIIILPDDAPVGLPLADYLGDIILDLDLTPNLARCLSIIGVAREVAALTGQKLRLEEPQMIAEGVPIDGQIEIEIADPDLCSRYSATLIKGVKIGPSPYWMRLRLTLAGMRPINNIVDVTNYVMLEWGQPLHAFDYDKLRKEPSASVPAIIVRRARPGEEIVTLDGVERELTSDMLLITDPGGPIAIAGVMGGLETEVTAETTSVLLESANFDYINNRRTSQALKLSSEASLRFGRGLPASLTVLAATRATELMRKLAGGAIAQGIADAYPVKQPGVTIELKAAEVERILGIEVPTDEIIHILSCLEFQVSGLTDSGQSEALSVSVPDHRLDVTIPADLIEEVARIYGYDKLPSTLMSDGLPPQRRNPALEGEERVRDILVGCGLQEVITYSLTNLESVAKLTPGVAEANPDDYLKLANPLSSEQEYMRQTLMASLLETMRDNFRYTDRVAIFEVSRVYLPREGQLLPDEPRRLGIALSGPRAERSWAMASSGMLDFYDLKGVIETLLTRLGVEGYCFVPVEHPTFHPGRTGKLMISGAEVGVLGEVHSQVLEAFDLPDQPVYLAELDLERLLEQIGVARYLKPIHRFPSVSQDLAVVVDEDVPAQKVQEAIVEAGGRLLYRVELFDLYRGEQIPPGKKSLAYSLTYQAEDRTLTDGEVAKVQERIVRHLAKELGAELRA
jgi:phenylalanyl-tRNA synthetase beta chain